MTLKEKKLNTLGKCHNRKYITAKKFMSNRRNPFLLTFEKLIQDGLEKREQISTHTVPVKSGNIFPYHLLEGLQVLVIRHKKFLLVFSHPSGMY